MFKMAGLRTIFAQRRSRPEGDRQPGQDKLRELRAALYDEGSGIARVREGLNPSFFKSFAERAGWSVADTIEQALGTTNFSIQFDAIVEAAKGSAFLEAFRDCRVYTRAAQSQPSDSFLAADMQAYRELLKDFPPIRAASAIQPQPLGCS